MSSRKLRPKGSIGRKLIVFAIASSIFSLVTSALTAYNDLAYQGLHSFSLVVMLIAFLGVIGTVISNRNYKRAKIQIVESEQKTPQGRFLYRVTPSRFWNFIHLDPPIGSDETPTAAPLADRVEFPWLRRISRARCEGTLVAVLRNLYVDADVLETLLQFPNLVVIDVQGCQVDDALWPEFVHFDQLEYLAVCGAIDEQSQRELHYSLPEVKAIFEPVQFVHSSADTV